MRRTLTLLVTTLFVTCPAVATATVFKLDLKGPSYTLPVEPGEELKFVLINADPPPDEYSITIEDETLPAFSLEEIGLRVAEAAEPAEIPIEGRYTLTKCQKLTVHVKRNDPKKEWNFVFRTGRCGKWLVHYGFSFLSSEDEDFFTRAVEPDANGEGGGFQILPEADRGEGDFEPTITFTFLPKGSNRKPYLPKFTAGIGADIEEPLVFAGMSWVIGDNVNIFLGVAGHEQNRLKGIYEPNQILQEDLEADQLTDETFDFNAIVGVGFRFDSNPFKKKDKKDGAGQ